MTDEEHKYRQCVYDIWIVSKFGRAFADELIDLMFANGFLIDTVTTSHSDCDLIRWKGRCYDDSLADYQFTAEWTINAEKFTLSEVHYYDLTSLEIEPVEAS